MYTISMAEDANGELLLLTPAGLCRIVDGSLGPPEAISLACEWPANCSRYGACWWIAKAIYGLERMGWG